MSSPDARRLARKIILSKPFVVRTLNRDGTVSGIPVSPYRYAATQAEAEAIKSDLENLNPGVRYSILPNLRAK
jgi:hypothetical protein